MSSGTYRLCCFICFTNKIKMIRFSVFVLIGGLIVFAGSCKKEFGTTNVKFVQTSPDAPALKVFNNSKELLGNFNYNDVSDYINLDRSNLAFQVKKGEEIVKRIGSSNFATDAFNAIYIVDSFGAINRMILSDAHGSPDAGKAQFRFLHLVPDMQQFKLFANGSVLFDDRAFTFANQGFANFISTDAGTYSFVAQTEENTITTDITLANNIVLEAGKTYTLYAKGFVNGSGAKALGLGVVVER